MTYYKNEKTAKQDKMKLRILLEQLIIQITEHTFDEQWTKCPVVIGHTIYFTYLY